MIRELKTLLAVAREGTFAAAGHRVGLTQAAVSAQMQRLEAELGLTLFDRTGRTAHLNPRGQQLLQQAQKLIELYGELGHSPSEPAPALRITLGAIVSMQRTLLPPVLSQLHARHPACRTRLIPGLSIELVNKVDSAEIDLAVIIRPPFALHSDLRWLPLVSEPYRLLVPAALPGDDWQQLLATQPLIRYDRSSFGGRQVDRFLNGLHLPLNERCELDDLDAIVQLVQQGVGVALLPQTLQFRQWPPGVRAIDLGTHTFHRDIGLVHRDPVTLSEPVRQLIADLSEHTRELSKPAST